MAAPKKPAAEKKAKGSRPRPLTVKQRKLVKGIVDGKTQKQAAKAAGLNESYASQILNEPKVKATLQDLMEHMGLSDGHLLKAHAEMIQATKAVSVIGGKGAESGSVEFVDVPDWQARGKGLEMAYKLKGAFSETVKVDVTDDLATAIKLARERLGK